MPKDAKFIIIIFGNKQKNLEIPEDLKELKKICEREFELTNIENFSFYFRDNLELDYKINEKDFKEFKSDTKNLNRNKIIIKDNTNNSTQSELYIVHSNIQNTIYSNESENIDLSECNNTLAEEIFSGSDSELNKFYSLEHLGRDTSKSHNKFINQLSGNDSLNQNSVGNRSINSNQFSSENNSELNHSNSMSTIYIKALSKEEYIIKQLKLENKALIEKISKLEAEIKNKDLEINNLKREKDQILEKKEKINDNLVSKIEQEN